MAASSSSWSSPFELTPLPPSILGSPGEVGEAPACLLDDHLHGGEVPLADADRVDGSVDGAFGDEHVRPEVAEAARVPRAPRERRHVVLDRERENGLLDSGDRRDVHGLAVRERTGPALGPPAASKRRRRDDADSHDRVLLERDQRRPHRDPARVVARPVDRVDDPATRARADRALLLTEDRVVGPSSASIRRSSDSTRRSASVTGVRSALVSTVRPERKRGSEIASAASASRSASSRSGLTPRP